MPQELGKLNQISPLRKERVTECVTQNVTMKIAESG